MTRVNTAHRVPPPKPRKNTQPTVILRMSSQSLPRAFTANQIWWICGNHSCSQPYDANLSLLPSSHERRLRGVTATGRAFAVPEKPSPQPQNYSRLLSPEHFPSTNRQKPTTEKITPKFQICIQQRDSSSITHALANPPQPSPTNRSHNKKVTIKSNPSLTHLQSPTLSTKRSRHEQLDRPRNIQRPQILIILSSPQKHHRNPSRKHHTNKRPNLLPVSTHSPNREKKKKAATYHISHCITFTNNKSI